MLRLQVYFLDNEDLFKRKYIFNDENEKWYDDNGLRTAFSVKKRLKPLKNSDGRPTSFIAAAG